MLIGFLVWGEKGGMEHVVNLPSRGKFDFVSDFGYLGDYLKRSISPW